MKIGIIGAGKVGVAIGHAIKKRGYTISAVADVLRDDALDVARSFIGDGTVYTVDNMEVVALSDVVAITTQDRAIQGVAKEIFDRSEDLGEKLFFHTSGADPSSILKPLDKKGASLGSLHPLQTFPDIESGISVLPETYIFIEGDEGALGKLTEIGQAIGYDVKTIGAEDKVLYHLSAVYVCNLLCALYYAGEEIMERIGIGLEPFLPIIHATMRNIEQKGPLKALTGPVVRGDAKTVQAHLSGIADMEQQRRVYTALSRVAVEMSVRRGTINDAVRETLETVLREDGK